MRQHQKRSHSFLALLLALSMLFSLTILPVSAEEPVKTDADQGTATLALDDDLLTLDMSEETFHATLTVPVSTEQSKWTTDQR